MENEHINPWLHIWSQPRKTMRYILSTDPKRVIIWLAILGGIIGGLTLAFSWKQEVAQLTRPFALFPLLGGLIGGAIVGLIHLYFSGWLYRLTGSWIGGKGTFTEVKSAVGWGNYPFIVSSLISIIGMFAATSWLKIFIGFINFVVLIWGLVIFLKLLSEAHSFSVWKGILTVLIACALIFVVFLLIGLLFPLLTPLFQ